METKAKQNRDAELVAEIANFLLRDRSLDAEGDGLLNEAWQKFRPRCEQIHFTRALSKVVRTARAMVRLEQEDALYARFAAKEPDPIPRRAEPLPARGSARRARRAAAPASEQLSMNFGAQGEGQSSKAHESQTACGPTRTVSFD